MSEVDVQRQILLALGRGDSRVFRQNVGIGWAGKLVNKSTSRSGFTVTLANARPLHAGLCVGSSDIIGWHSFVILPEHVGCKVAVFLANEVKSARGPERDEQEKFRNAVIQAGGIAAVVRSVEDAQKSISLWVPLK